MSAHSGCAAHLPVLYLLGALVRYEAPMSVNNSCLLATATAQLYVVYVYCYHR